jgi:hypothetical protein
MNILSVGSDFLNAYGRADRHDEANCDFVILHTRLKIDYLLLSIVRHHRPEDEPLIYEPFKPYRLRDAPTV